MADENTPRDASAKEVLKAFQELKPEITAAARELKAAGGKIEAAGKGDVTVARGGRGAALSTPEEVAQGTAAVERQGAAMGRNLRTANEQLAALKAQADEMTKLTALADALGRRGLGMAQFGSTAPTVFPTGRSPFSAGGRVVGGGTAESFAEARAAAQAAKDDLLAAQTLEQRLRGVGAETFRPAPGAGILALQGGLILPPGAGRAAARPGGLVIPAPGIATSSITPGERARQAELAQELRTRQALRAEARAEQAAVEAEANSLARLLGMLVEAQGDARAIARARADAAQSAEREEASQARLNREYAAAHPLLSPAERRLAQAEFLGTPTGAIPGAPGRIPGSEKRPSPFPISYVNQGPAYEQAAAEAQFGTARSMGTAARDVNALSGELTRLGTVQASASQQMRRHGALTTEFLTALARGETTLDEFGYHITATAGKFAGWTAAAAGVYGLLNAVGRIKQGAIDSSSGVNQLSRVLNSFHTDDAQKAFTDLSREFNVPVATAVDAVYRMGQRFHALPDAVEAARASLYSFKTGEVDVATSTENLLAIVNGFGLGARDLTRVYDQINQAQNTFGIRIGDTEAGLAKAAGTYRNAGGDLNYLLALMVAIGRATNRSGQEIGTGIARGVNQIRQAKNQAKLESQGVDVDPENFQKTVQSALVAARRPGADLQTIATGLFGNQYARLIAPVLRDQRVLNQAIGDTSPESSKGSAQRELSKVLHETGEELKALGNGLERMGGLLAQAGVFDGLGGALRLMNLMERSVEHILGLFNDIPAPLRHTLAIAGELYAVTRLIQRSSVGAGIADATGLSFIGPGKAERARREAIIGTRSAEQTAANAFEGAINASSMSKTQALAQRGLAQDLALQAEREKNDVAATALRQRSNDAMERYSELQAQAAAQEQLALQYQEAYTAAVEKRVALQKREITAEEALTATAAAMPGGIIMSGGRVVRGGESAAARAVASRQYASPIGPMMMGGAPITDYNRWAAQNVPGRYDGSLENPARGIVQYPGPIGPMTAAEAQEFELANRSRQVEQEITRSGGRLAQAGAEVRAAGGRLAGGIGNFVTGMGMFGLAFTAYIIGDQIRKVIDDATSSIERQNQSLDAVPHSLDALQQRITDAQDKSKHGAQHKIGSRLADFFAGGGVLGPYGGRIVNGLLTGDSQTQVDVQNAADKARASADQAIIHARAVTAGPDVSQNVGLANAEIIKAAQNQAKNAQAMGESRADVNKAFERYVRDAGVSIEGLTTGKTSQALLNSLRNLKQQALSSFGSTANDPFAAFRGGIDAALAVMDTLVTKGSTYGTSGKDLDQLLRGATFVTAKYGASNDPKDIQKVNEAQAKIDTYINQMTTDLKDANAEVERAGSQRNLRLTDITPAYLSGQARSVQRGTDQNYAEYIRKMRGALAHVRDGMGRQRDQLTRVNAELSLAEAQRSGDLKGLSSVPGENRSARLFPGDDQALDREIARLRKKRDALKEQVKDASGAADKRAEKLQAEIDAAYEQQYQDTQTRIQTRSAYQQSIASDKSDQIAVQIKADGELVRAAMKDHGPNRWVHIMEALTQQNNDIGNQAQQALQDIQTAGDLRTSRIIGVGKAFDARRLHSELNTAQQKLAAARSEANYPGKKDDITQAETAVNNLRQQILEQAQSDTKDAHDLAQQLYDARRSVGLAAITDPTKRLKYTLATDQHELSMIHRSDFKTQQEFLIARYQQLAKIRQDQTDLQQQGISDDIDSAKFEHDMGKISDDAYISQLKQIIHMKGITKQTKRQLLLEIKQLTDQNAGDLELNVGNVHLPTIYEIRRAMGGRSQRFGGPGQMTIHSNPTVHIHVANSSDVPGVGTEVEKVINGPVRANMRAAGLIG